MTKKRYFIELSYNGTDYHGWQIQPNGITVQECLDKALSIYFRQTIISLGCGRTDAGVHATQFYAHFDLIDIPDQSVQYSIAGINSLLPYTIAVKRVFAVSDDAHARFDATARAYKYYLHFDKDPFKLDRSWLYKGNLNFNAMNEAAALLLNFRNQIFLLHLVGHCSIIYEYIQLLKPNDIYCVQWITNLEQSTIDYMILASLLWSHFPLADKGVLYR